MSAANSPLSIHHPPFIKVAIVDDHAIVVDGLERLINVSETVRVTGKAYSVAGCRQLLKTMQVDVLLLDVSLPDGDGVELCPEIKRKYPQVKILILTSYGELATITQALNVGVDGYILKNSMPEEVLEGIRVTAEGGRFLCDHVTGLLQNYAKNSPEFTRRELEVLRYIKEGLTSTEIADRICRSFDTVRSYRKALYIKLNAHSTRELICKAVELGLL